MLIDRDLDCEFKWDSRKEDGNLCLPLLFCWEIRTWPNVRANFCYSYSLTITLIQRTTLTSPCCPSFLGIIMLVDVSHNQNDCLVSSPISSLNCIRKIVFPLYLLPISQIGRNGGERSRNTQCSSLSKTSISSVHRLSSGFHQNPWNFAIHFSRVKLQHRVPCHCPFMLYCGINASTQESKSHVEYTENTTKMKDMYVKDICEGTTQLSD